MSLLGASGLFLSQLDSVLGSWPRVRAATTAVSGLLLFLTKTEKVFPKRQ